MVSKSFENGEFPDEDDFDRGTTVGATIELGPNVITPEFSNSVNPLILFEGADIFKFNLYRTLLEIREISDKPILSPLAGTSAIGYKFDYEGVDFINGKKCYIILVTPLNKTENLFKGKLWVNSLDYSLSKIDLTLEGGNLLFFNKVNLRIDYAQMSDAYVINDLTINYSVKNGRKDVIGESHCVIDSVEVNQDFSSVKFNREIKVYDEQAFNRDSNYWADKRPDNIDSTLVLFMSKSDSLKNYYESPDYLHKIDSAFNKIDFWTPIVGLGHRNRVRGNEWYIGGVFDQVTLFGIGGYRHALPGYFQKEIKDDFTLRLEGFVDYGPTNQDVKTKTTLGFTYKPEKFVRTQVTFGDYYDMINDNAS